ncbi:MAG: L-threonine 3-dehydrogenase [Planctomycetes bacterium]|nr:L-threonine 3-dehydrogenase [Planctomycetota bacterium]
MMGTMLAVVKALPGPGAKISTVETPAIGPADVLIKVIATSICGTDLHIYNWDAWAQSQIRTPLVFGHEFHGEVVEVGREVATLHPGDRVSVESHVPCGRCHQCTHGMMHICDELKIIGVHRAGCFAQYVAVPALCAWKVSPGMPPEVASLMEPMGNSVHVVSEAQVSGKTVAVFGCGPAGLFATGCARAKGAAALYAVDINRHRLELAKAMGADEVINGADPDLIGRLVKLSGGYGVDVALEMSGSQKAIVNALRSLKKGGTFVAFGIPSRPIELDLANDVILNGRRMLGVVGRRMFEDWVEMQRLLDGGKLDPRPIITHRFKLAEFEQAIATIRQDGVKCGKVVLFP